jgi:hypothetical protein
LAGIVTGDFRKASCSSPADLEKTICSSPAAAKPSVYYTTTHIQEGLIYFNEYFFQYEFLTFEKLPILLLNGKEPNSE